MPSCVDSTQMTGPDAPSGAVLYTVSSAPTEFSKCAYVVESGPEYSAALAAQDKALDIFFVAAVVVLFALGWIAGAQR